MQKDGACSVENGDASLANDQVQNRHGNQVAGLPVLRCFDVDASTGSINKLHKVRVGAHGALNVTVFFRPIFNDLQRHLFLIIRCAARRPRASALGRKRRPSFLVVAIAVATLQRLALAHVDARDGPARRLHVA